MSSAQLQQLRASRQARRVGGEGCLLPSAADVKQKVGEFLGFVTVSSSSPSPPTARATTTRGGSSPSR